MKAVVAHSGGMDSTICLALALREFGVNEVVSLSFNYGQRHAVETKQAKLICEAWGISHKEATFNVLQELTESALLDPLQKITHRSGDTPPNSLIMGRNGLMAQLAGIYTHHVGADSLWMGVMEQEGSNSGYRDCSRNYIDLVERVLQMDLNNPNFAIRTPLVYMTKLQTLQLAQQLGILDFLKEHTITCYEGLPDEGCKCCPSCKLRNEAFAQLAALKTL